MGMEHYQAREFVRVAQALDHYMAQLVGLLKSKVSEEPFREYGVARLVASSGLESELCVAVHLRRLVTVREHVWHVQPDRKHLYGCVSVVDLVDEKPLGKPLIQMIVRHDGFISFDGSIDMVVPIQEDQGYGDRIATSFSQALLLAVQSQLRILA